MMCAACERRSEDRMAARVLIVVLCLVLQPAAALPKTINILGLFDSDNPGDIQAFQDAINEINEPYSCLRGSKMEGTIIPLHPGDSFEAALEVCHYLSTGGVAAVVGPQLSPTTAQHVRSLCHSVQVPHLEARWSYRTPSSSDCPNPYSRDCQRYTANFYPSPTELSQAYVSLINEWFAKRIVLIYEDNDGLVRLQDVLTWSRKGPKVHLAQIPDDPDQDYRPFLKTIKRQTLIRHLVIDCRAELIRVIMDQANEIGLVNEYYSFMFTSLDLHTVDFQLYQAQQGRVNITGLRLLRDDWKQSSDFCAREPRQAPEMAQLSTTSALVYDALHSFAYALRANDPISVPQINCDTGETWGSNGTNLMRHILERPMLGRSGHIRLNGAGRRDDFQLDVLELGADGLEVVGSWSRLAGVNYTRTWGQKTEQIATSMSGRIFRVVVGEANPYVMQANDTTEGFKGFCIDLMAAIAKKKKFKVVYHASPNNIYGTFSETEGPTGMIKELMENTADMAIADLSITLERERGVDFSMPWMNLGISILYRKPVKAPPQLFSFMGPLSTEVWIYMGTAYLGVSVLLFILARLAPEEWDNPNPCIEDPDVLENQFTMLNSLWFTIGSLMQQGSEIAPKLSPQEWQEPGVCSMAGADPDFLENEMNLRNSFWFTIGSLMQQGCDINPKAVSTRMVAAWWWVFTLIMISSYTANLAAFLTAGRMDTPIKSAEDLAKQTTIKYGAKNSGSTKNFFRASSKEVYRRMYNFMESARPSVHVDSSNEGVERVKKSNGLYAYLMESTGIEYVVERNCELTQIGGLLDHKSYGIALQPGSPYTPVINSAILEIQEEGTLLQLKNKWWKVDEACPDDNKVNANELGIDNVGGVFVVLLGGMCVAVLIAFGEFIWKSRKLAHAEHTSLMNEMAKELKFAFSCKGSSKPVSKPEPLRQAQSASYLANGPVPWNADVSFEPYQRKP